ASAANLFWGNRNADGTYTKNSGQNVIVAIIDSGIDFCHQDFRNPDGTTRVKYAWDQSIDGTSAFPAAGPYGTEYSAADFNAGMSTQCPNTGTNYLKDTDNHGTAMAGIAAGNGKGTGNNIPAYTYVGIAPEADIIAVKLRYNTDGSLSDQKIIDGVNYALAKAG